MFEPSPPAGLAPDEKPILDLRRHGVILAGRIAAPAIVFLTPIALIVWSMITHGSNPAVADQTIKLSQSVLAVLAVPLLLWLAYNIYDWANDSFHVTNRRVIRAERNFIFSRDFKEANLSQIQNVAVTVPDPLASMLNYGTVIIETAAMAGKIEFDSVGDPFTVQRLLFALRGIPVPAQPPSPVPAIKSLRDIFLFLFPFVPILTADGSVVYHKHWFILLKVILLPVLFLLLALFAAVLTNTAVFLVLLAVVLPALWYQWANWENDIYVLTQNRIIDIVRIPLIKEERREALLEQIQNVSVTLPNLLSRILDMGTVFVETAGKAENFEFRTVPHPMAVKDEINRRLDAVRSNRKQADAEARRHELEEILTEFIRSQYGTLPPHQDGTPPGNGDTPPPEGTPPPAGQQ
jgi:uncharacterized membrane protein YdbT with pleckstrin-like domain